MIEHLPSDWRDSVLVGRILTREGPTPVVIAGGRVRDVSRHAATVSQLLNGWNGDVPAGEDLGPLESFGFTRAFSDQKEMRLLSPFDLQCIKASGVTFAISAMERVIEERCRGDASKADSLRASLRDSIGADIRAVKPGSEQAKKLKAALIADGLWSQYLEVAIGPDAEIFTKGPTLSTVGWGDWIGVRSDSAWNNPEPEIVLAVDSAGRILGATLGNDVNLRDFEGRSALLLSKAKDNNASCALGPLLRLFDNTFSLDDVRKMDIALTVTGQDGFVLEGHSSIGKISRDPTDLVAQTIGAVHQYPDGFALFLGTMFAPVKDRDAPGEGFTHKRDDIVTIASPRLGKLTNRMRGSDECEPWTFGVGALMRNLAKRKAI
jgi:fumarylacetoacetate (FAA) hydrolase family protein